MTTLINGQPSEQLNAQDRGLAYGDGVYRTLTLQHGQPQLWRWQYARLAQDASKLNLPVPEAALLLAELAQAAQGLNQAVAKITLTRGNGQRGYAPPNPIQPTRIISVSAWAGYPAHYREQGMNVRWCQLRLAQQPALAGIKHLNRLENVLARSEWQDPDIDEGLLLDQQKNVIGGTMSNLYVLQGRVLKTPLLDQCGVHGAVRDWLLEYCQQHNIALQQARINQGEVLSADALALSNSLLGLCPIRQLGQRQWEPHPRWISLQQALQQAALA